MESKSKNKCSVEVCLKEAQQRGMCFAHLRAEWRKNPENKAKANASTREYHRKHRVKLLEQKKEYYQENKEEKKEKARKYRKENSAKIAATGRQRLKRPEIRWSKIKHSRSKKLGFHLTKETFTEWASKVVNQVCYYCNTSELGAGHGVDRIDSSLPYQLDNMRACCKDCNRAKASLSETAFYQLVTRVFNHAAKKTDN